MKISAVTITLMFVLSTVSHATTWIGTVSSSHCTADLKAIPGDDNACIVFVANDQEVYKLPDQERAKRFIGKEVTITGTVTQELTIGVSYETQGTLAITSITLTAPLQLQPQETSAYRDWMLSLQTSLTATHKAISAKDNLTVSAEATKLATTLDKVAEFWRAHKDTDAAGFADDGKAAATLVATAQNPFDQSVTLQKVQDRCANCHLARRSGKLGSFKIVK